MNAISKKLKSRAGASITFALMIFLVCAVVSGIVIVAASTSSGRLAGLKEMDERYYIVTDTAEDLCKRFEGKEVTVTYNAEGNATVEPVGTDKLVADASICVALGTPISNRQAPGGDTGTVSIAGEGGRTYNCSIVENLQSGLLTFTITATGGASTQSKYVLRLTFASNVKRDAVDMSAATGRAKVSWKLRDIRKNPTTTA